MTDRLTHQKTDWRTELEMVHKVLILGYLFAEDREDFKETLPQLHVLVWARSATGDPLLAMGLADGFANAD